MSYLVLFVMFTSTLCVLPLAAQRVVAVGDLHGDYDQALRVMAVAGAITPASVQAATQGGTIHWIAPAGTTILVLGDALDVGPDDIKIVNLFLEFKKASEEQKNSGNFVMLLGNHEVQNLRLDFHRSNIGDGNVHSNNLRLQQLSMSSPTGQFLRSRQILHRAGKFLFCHGGVSLRTISLLLSFTHTARRNNKEIFTMEEVDDLIHRFNANVSNILTIAPDKISSVSPIDQDRANGLFDMLLVNINSPVLYRPLNEPCNDVTDSLDLLGLSAMVVGHTPHDTERFERWEKCKGRLFAADFGMSRWKYGQLGKVAAIEINDVNNPSSVELLTPEGARRITAAPGFYLIPDSIQSVVNVLFWMIISSVGTAVVQRWVDRRNRSTQEDVGEDDVTREDEMMEKGELVKKKERRGEEVRKSNYGTSS